MVPEFEPTYSYVLRSSVGLIVRVQRDLLSAPFLARRHPAAEPIFPGSAELSFVFFLFVLEMKSYELCKDQDCLAEECTTENAQRACMPSCETAINRAAVDLCAAVVCDGRSLRSRHIEVARRPCG